MYFMKAEKDGYCFLIQSVSLWILVWESRGLIFSITIKCVFIAVILLHLWYSIVQCYFASSQDIISFSSWSILDILIILCSTEDSLQCPLWSWFSILIPLVCYIMERVSFSFNYRRQFYQID